MHQAIVNLAGGHAPICISFDQSQDATVYDLKKRITTLTNVNMANQSISTMGGRLLSDEASMFNQQQDGPTIFNMSLRLLGGKGGFGSMLRAQGGRMNAQKTTNFEACRDLQGRRIRTVSEAKKLQEELDALPERERERREKTQKKIEEGLKGVEQKKYRFDDTQFLEDREQMVDNVKSAVGSLLKNQQLKQQKKKAVTTVSLNMFDDEEDSEEEDSEEEDNNDEEEVSEEEEEKEVESSSKRKRNNNDDGGDDDSNETKSMKKTTNKKRK
ncbi:telomere stability and silencing-domain-containing protein [Circinella umbellata]|nr:telomere stability and silencing-domain-containing protein [Circinella umbellata]